MRKLLIIACLFTPNLYAMSCPSNGSILDTGYDLQQAIQVCGRPDSVNQYQETSNINETLTYNKNVLGSNVKLTLTFNYNKLSNINIVETSKLTCEATNQFGQRVNAPCAPVAQNTIVSGICGPLIQAGNDISYVRSACGNPDEQNISASRTTNVVELRYRGAGPNVLVFKNDKLVDWKY